MFAPLGGFAQETGRTYRLGVLAVGPGGNHHTTTFLMSCAATASRGTKFDRGRSRVTRPAWNSFPPWPPGLSASEGWSVEHGRAGTKAVPANEVAVAVNRKRTGAALQKRHASQVWRSKKEKELHLLSRQGAEAFESLPRSEISAHGPDLKEGEVDRLGLPLRIILGEPTAHIPVTIAAAHVSSSLRDAPLFGRP